MAQRVGNVTGLHGDLSTGERIRLYRTRLDMAQHQLGDVLGVSEQTVARWEKDLRVPSGEELIQLVGVFGVTADYLLGLRPTPSKSIGKRTTRRRVRTRRRIGAPPVLLAVV